MNPKKYFLEKQCLIAILKSMKSPQIIELKRRLHEIAHLRSVLELLNWDQEVNMPVKGSNARATTLAELSGIVHAKFIAIDSDKLLTKLKKQVEEKKVR